MADHEAWLTCAAAAGRSRRPPDACRDMPWATSPGSSARYLAQYTHRGTVQKHQPATSIVGGLVGCCQPHRSQYRGLPLPGLDHQSAKLTSISFVNWVRRVSASCAVMAVAWALWAALLALCASWPPLATAQMERQVGQVRALRRSPLNSSKPCCRSAPRRRRRAPWHASLTRRPLLQSAEGPGRTWLEHHANIPVHPHRAPA